MAENSGAIDIYGSARVYTEQAGAGVSTFFVANRDTTASTTHQSRIATQQLGSGFGRTLIYAASYTNDTTRGELTILTETGANFLANFGTTQTNADNAFSLFSTSAVENIRLNTGGVSWLMGGNVGIGINTSLTGKLQVNTGTANNNAITLQANALTARTYGLGLNSDGSLAVYDNSAAATRLVVSTGGDVGIGVLLPAEKLDVVGNIKLSGYVTGGSWQGNAVYPAYGGTGATTLTGVVIGNGTSSMTAQAGTSGQLLRRNIANTDYEFFSPNFVSNPMVGLGDMIYSNASGAALRLVANTSATKKFLAAQGDGTSGDAPFWETISASTIGALSSVGIAVPTGFSASGSPLTSNGTITISFASGYALPTTAKQTEWDSAYTNRITTLTTTGNSGASSLISNTLNIPTYTLAGLGGLSNPMTGANGAGDMIYANGAGAPIRLAPNTTTTKKYLSMTGDGTNGDAPFWDTITGFTGSGTTNYITKFTSSSAIGNSLLYDNAVSVSIGNTSPQKLFHLSGANGATVIRMENTDTSVSIGETIGAIEFYGNDTASGVGGIIDAYGGGLTGEVNIDVWAGTNGNIVGGVTVKYTGAVNFTPLVSAPSPAAAGDVYYDSSTNKLRCYDGTSWNDLF